MRNFRGFGTALLFATTILLGHGRPAVACGAWDIGCEARETLQNPVKKVEAIPGKIGNQWDTTRQDIHNGLDNINPQINQSLRDFDRARINFQSQVFTGPALEQWLIQSRNDAMNGAMPMPDQIKQAMNGWYSPQQMSNVFYKIGDGGALNLGNAATGYGEAAAITLIDVIVFRDANWAGDYATWAHELKHITQYQDWGVHSFAVQYMQSWNSVENPAYGVQRQYQAALDAGQISIASAAIQPPPVPQPPPPAPPQFASQNQPPLKCYLGPQPNNFCFMQPGVFFQFGSPCTCGTWQGRVGY